MEIRRHEPVKLIVAMLSSDISLFDRSKSLMKKRFGRTDFESQTIDFNFTDYYRKEMGDNLKRCFISFERPIWPERLCAIKSYTRRLEINFSRLKSEASRRINLDPGYITAAKLVLATYKDNSHRIYIDNGIFEEITLSYQQGTFKPLEWTYPDYRSKDYIDVFNRIRQIYLSQVRKRADSSAG